MKKNNHIYSIFASVISIITIIISSIIINIAYQNDKSNMDFPTYSYEEYIDYSDENVFYKNAGGQLYEAESASLGGKHTLVNNIAASNDQLVSDFERGSSVNFSINSDSTMYAKLILNLSYSSKAERGINANFLFSLIVNGEELDIHSVYIQHALNQYDLHEYNLGVIETKFGQNNIEIISYDYNFQIDYLVLISQEDKTSSENTIGEKNKIFYFNSLDSSQVFEAERMRLAGPLIIDEYSCSSFLAVYFINPESQTFSFINSDSDCSSEISLRLKSPNDEVELNDIRLMINNTLYSGIGKSTSEDYYLFNYGFIELNKGINRIEISNLQKQIYLDCFILNNNINHSQFNINEKFEAEDAVLDNCVIEENEGVSNKQNVGYCYEGSTISFHINSLTKDSKKLGLRISYDGDRTYLNEVLKITFHHRELDLDNIMIYKTGYQKYYDLPCSVVDFEIGENELVIESLTGAYNLDYIFFYGSEDLSTSRFNSIEAERVLVFGSQIENNVLASEKKNVGFNSVDSYVKYCFESSREISKNLTLQISIFNTNSAFLGDCLKILINDQEIVLDNIEIELSSSWIDFKRVVIGNILIKEGYNSLVIISKEECYNLDYLRLIN